ncbi:hypothetical protein CEXT_675951 [Caerostris extrusa]|uniref:Uncharacterized protein n=1 Tax=Caerostris extrusa TaxID=172846 RepID=A0AAV4NGY6_CAEEX|nr:hypothetical protein CEXT_675951 [Caerostris extrusa]
MFTLANWIPGETSLHYWCACRCVCNKEGLVDATGANKNSANSSNYNYRDSYRKLKMMLGVLFAVVLLASAYGQYVPNKLPNDERFKHDPDIFRNVVSTVENGIFCNTFVLIP